MKRFSQIVILLLAMVITHKCNAQVAQLWGMAYNGGINNQGAIFKINMDGTGFVSKYSFANPTGKNPKGNLINVNGTLFGMTESGGINNGGVIFKYDPVYDVYTKLFDFNTAQGKNPTGSLYAIGTKLYGMAYQGGAYTKGVLFSYDISTDTYADLFDFNAQNGQYPTGNLMKASDGKLYGMTPLGGAFSDGIIFRFDVTNNSFTKLFDFNGGNGSNPRGSLMQASSGIIYGVTYGGGDSSRGIIFNFDPVTLSYGVLFTFHGINGAYPVNSLIQANNGLLYGFDLSNPNGYNVGSLFDQNTTNTLHHDILTFPTVNFGHPLGNAIQGSDGKLYAMTYYGGTDSVGTIFSINIFSNVWTRLGDFSYLNITGANPYGDLLEMPANTGINSISNSSGIVTVQPNPFHDYTKITMDGFENKEELILCIHDLFGRELKRIFMGVENSFLMDREGMEGGMYFYKIISIKNGETLKTGKIIVE